jgi:UDP-N-acetylglucosamine 2-epimerase (non-hydrolysing)
MKFVHIVAARPNFIKAAPVIKELEQANQTNYIIHTNQHYDYQMSKVFFEELNIPEPDIHLGVGSGTHAEQTSSTMVLIEEQLSVLEPDYVVIYGDVNSSMAGAMAAAKLNIPIIHIESGCRSYDDTMPEEINRKIIDTISTILICTEESAYTNLVGLGLVNSNTIVAGNTAIDSLYDLPSLYDIDLGFKYYLATFHRPFNVDDADKLDSILAKLEQFSLPVVIPAHPRLKKNLKREYKNILFKDPFGYVEFISYIKNSEGVISDSGGVQCECAFFSKPLLTLRPSTEHLITLDYGNKLINVSELSEDNFDKTFELNIPSVWDGNASKRAVDFILEYDTQNS